MSAAAAIAILRDAYPRSNFPDRTIQLYGAALGSLPDDAVVAAVNELIQTSEFLPTIAAIKRAVAEREMRLPSAEDAWEIAERGSLRNAPEPVRRAAEHVGGRWQILNSENPTTVRAQFLRAYDGLRERALTAYVLGEDPFPKPALEAPTMAALPPSDRVRPRPVMARLSARWAGRPLPPPTEEEKADAIAVLRDLPAEDREMGSGSWLLDPLYQEAERIFEEGAA